MMLELTYSLLLWKKTGREPLLLRMQIRPDLYLETADFRTNDFSFFSQYNIYNAVTLTDERPIYKETNLVPIKAMKNDCKYFYRVSRRWGGDRCRYRNC